jgi:hypothetical protein
MEINDLHEFVAPAFALVKAGRRFCTPQSPLCSLPFPSTFFFKEQARERYTNAI